MCKVCKGFLVVIETVIHCKMVRLVGFEPTTYGLEVRLNLLA